MANPTLDDRTFQQQFEQAQAAAELANLTEPSTKRLKLPH